jgi:predicted AAA+ superfamily ATPase
MAARCGGLMNMSELSRTADIAHATLRRYLGLLEAIFLFQPLPAWSTNLGKRLVKAPKSHLIDSGVSAHLRGETDPRRLSESNALGALLETFVLQEVRKQLSWSTEAATAYHFRSAAGQEVDIVLETPRGAIAGIEVKAAASINKGAFAGLESLAATAGKRFVHGAVIYLGEQVLRFSERLTAIPIQALWHLR